jgi:hypothetical protein
LMLPHGVCSAVAGEGAFDGTLLGRIACIFHDVVFDQGIGAPAVDGEEAYSTGDTERTGEVDGTIFILLAKADESKARILTWCLQLTILYQRRSPGSCCR